MDKLDFTRLKENTTHGNFILPFSIYKGTISPTFPSIAVHWHEEIEVIKVPRKEAKNFVKENNVSIKTALVLSFM